MLFFPLKKIPAFQLLGILLGIVGPLCAIPDLGHVSCSTVACEVWKWAFARIFVGQRIRT